MTTEDFVERIIIAVYESTIKDAVSLLEAPPGRRPSPGLADLSRWFNRLSPEDRRNVQAAIQLAAGNAVFGMLTVLDGDRAIRSVEENVGSLELRYHVGGQSILLNDPDEEPLHDIFAGKVPVP